MGCNTFQNFAQVQVGTMFFSGQCGNVCTGWQDPGRPPSSWPLPPWRPARCWVFGRDPRWGSPQEQVLWHLRWVTVTLQIHRYALESLGDRLSLETHMEVAMGFGASVTKRNMESVPVHEWKTHYLKSHGGSQTKPTSQPIIQETHERTMFLPYRQICREFHRINRKSQAWKT